MKRAYHDILLPDGTLQHGPVVVETDSEDRFLGWHLLDEKAPHAPEVLGNWCSSTEESLTEWIGGTYTV
jgi:hypothetical protein